MKYKNVIGHYSKARQLGRIYLRTFENGECFPHELKTVYEKNVTYRTYIKNLKRIIAENEIA
tara:strand:- start:220 stop:405 length:186 start_codon:yes stop_codon:yes gene_type:complete